MKVYIATTLNGDPSFTRVYELTESAPPRLVKR